MNEEHPSALFQEVRQAVGGLRGALCLSRRVRLLTQYVGVDPAVLAEAAAEAGGRRRAAEGLVGLLRSLAQHVSDPFQQNELRRLVAHLDAVREAAQAEKALLGRLQDHGGKEVERPDMVALTGVLAEARERHQALESASRSVLLEGRVQKPSQASLSSRLVVALAAAVVQEALAVERVDPVLHAVDLTPSMRKSVAATAGDAASRIGAFAKVF